MHRSWRMRLRSRFVAVLAIIAVLAPLGVAAPDVGAQTESEPPSNGIDFGVCADVFGPTPPPDAPPIDCGRFDVPIDYDDPAAGTLSLAITRFPAAVGPENAKGNLFVNPGGPGAPALDMVIGVGLSGLFSEWNLIGIDPRGVGGSGALGCDLVVTSPFPTGKSFEGSIEQSAQHFAECNGDEADRLFFAQLDTANVARDFDTVRAALGDDKLNLFAASYGTHLGAVYAVLFPQRVGRFILDSPVLLDDRTEAWLNQVRGFQDALNRFDAGCAAEPSCALNPFGVKSVYKHLEWRLAQSPMQATVDGPTGSTQVTVDVQTLRDAFLPSLYIGRDIWPDMAEALLAAAWGDASQIAFFADVFQQQGFSASTYLGITCHDDPSRPGLHEARQAVRDEILAGNDVFAFLVGLETVSCTEVPVVEDPTPELTIEPGATAPMLVIAQTHDPATPYSGALNYVSKIGTSRLLTVHDDGHSVVTFGNGCVDAFVVRFLNTGSLPGEGAECGPAGRFGFDAELIPDGLLVLGVRPGAPVDGVLEIDDVVIDAGGQGPFYLPPVGDAVTITVLRDGVETVLGPVAPVAPYWLPG